MSVVLTFENVEPLREALRAGDFRFEERPHAHFLARREGVTLTAYHSGKLVITGPQAEEYAGVLAGKRVAQRTTGPGPGPGPGPSSDLVAAPHIGSDEVGKGDYFGPLVVAAVFVPDAATSRALRDAGARDSKLVAPPDIGPLASLVRARCPHRIVVIPPARYNALYAEMRNLNDLLAWGHARALEDLLGDVGDVPIVVDQFARGVLERHLMPRARAAPLTITPGAGRDVAVAAASIVARAEFVASVRALSARIGMPLPLGAGAPVVAAARALVAAKGAEALGEVAKLHFATTRSVLGG